MTDREAQIEALWTYEISTEKILRRAVKKGFISQTEADEFSEKLFEQLDAKKIPGFLPSPLGEKMRAEDVRVNPYVSMTEIARGKRKRPVQAILFKAGCGVIPQSSTCGCGRRFTTRNFKKMPVRS